jgi:hypothetical protein
LYAVRVFAKNIGFELLYRYFFASLPVNAVINLSDPTTSDQAQNLEAPPDDSHRVHTRHLITHLLQYQTITMITLIISMYNGCSMCIMFKDMYYDVRLIQQTSFEEGQAAMLKRN